jgi:hypothetical protein
MVAFPADYPRCHLSSKVPQDVSIRFGFTIGESDLPLNYISVLKISVGSVLQCQTQQALRRAF